MKTQNAQPSAISHRSIAKQSEKESIICLLPLWCTKFSICQAFDPCHFLKTKLISSKPDELMKLHIYKRKEQHEKRKAYPNILTHVICFFLGIRITRKLHSEPIFEISNNEQLDRFIWLIFPFVFFFHFLFCFSILSNIQFILWLLVSFFFLSFDQPIHLDVKWRLDEAVDQVCLCVCQWVTKEIESAYCCCCCCKIISLEPKSPLTWSESNLNYFPN